MTAAADGRELADKLRRLRRETGPKRDADGSAARSRARELPAWFAARSVGRRRRVGLDEAGAADGRRTLGLPVDLQHRSNERGRYAERVRRVARSEKHGDWRLSEVADASITQIARLAHDGSLEALDLERAVYLDVETTGLSGGAGTTSFLVALGRFDADEFELWQGFLPGPEDEAAMLSEVARRVRAAGAIVSFFGKSFDRHRLEDKMRLHGIDPPFDDAPHLDLYHPLARLYRGAFPDGRLQRMERELCGVEREDDLPGSFAPEAWFDFLAGRAHRLEDVFRHNADDVSSLVVLAAHLGRVTSEARADGRELAGPAWTRARALALLCHRERNGQATLKWIERATACDAPLEVQRELAFVRCEVWKRDGDVVAAVDGYRELAQAGRDSIALAGWVELAKLAEHRLRDVDLALDASERAHELCAVCCIGPRRARTEHELARRLQRLRKKQGEA